MKSGIKETLKQYKNISLSDSDVMRLVGHKARVLIYDELKKFKTLDEALSHHGAIFLLYQQRKDYGHWVAVIKTGNKIEFFDPYGIWPDNELDWVSKETNIKLGQDKPYLSILMFNSPYELTYNNYKFQKKGSGINTCGRWSALRIAMRKMDLEEFKKNFYGEKSDDLVTILTSL